MELLKATTEAEARALNDKALAWAKANQRAIGGSWSEVYTDKTGFGIVFEPSIQGAFSKTETGEVKTGEVIELTKVEDVVIKTTDDKGKTTGDWEVKPFEPEVKPKLLTRLKRAIGL